MAFDKAQTEVRERTSFDLDDSNDLRVIKEFEQELNPYLEKVVEVFGKRLTGFKLYLHENSLFRYSKKYPDGAVFFDKLQKFHFAKLKWEALENLKWRRDAAKEHEAEDFNNLHPATV